MCGKLSGYLLTWLVTGVQTWPGVTTFTRLQLGAASERAHAGAQSEVTARLHTCTPRRDHKFSYVVPYVNSSAQYNKKLH